MAFDPGLGERISALIGIRPDVEEKKMFGGLGWMLNGNMWVGVWHEYLIIRIGIDAYEEIKGNPGVSSMDITGKPMKGWAKVGPDGVSEDKDLKSYITLAEDFVGTLPPK